MCYTIVIACSVGQSDFDAAEIYTAAGYAVSADQESVFVYYGGMACECTVPLLLSCKSS